MAIQVPDGALILFLNQKIRTLLLQLSDAIEGMLDQAVQIAAIGASGSLIGVDANGVPFIITTQGNAIALLLDGTGIPYVDGTLFPIALDPFGVNGGTPGFPCPSDWVKIIQMIATDASGRTKRVDIIPEKQANSLSAPQRTPCAFLNGNRLVPVRRGIAPYADSWSNIVSVTVSYIAMRTVSVLTDNIDFPSVLHEALVAGLVVMLARGCPALTAAERNTYAGESALVDKQIEVNAQEMIGDVMESSVVFKR